MDRRGFLRSFLILLGSTTLASFAYPLIRFLEPPRSGAQAGRIVLKKADLQSVAAKDILVNNTPAILLNVPGKGFVALSKVCTHLGCLVEYDPVKKRLLCPCHAGVYTLEGNVVSGPPPKPLQRYAVRIEGDEVIIG